MIGEMLGRYRVISRIGEGGMGVVYLAEHALIGRRAAVKVLRAEMSEKQDHVTRFFNEARAIAAIHHENIVDVYDFGHGPGGSAYIVMELLEGESLAQLLVRETKLPITTAFAISKQVAGALAAAHAQSIVHRDLKPANIHLLPDPNAPGGVHVKVLDFGIAKLPRVQSGVDTAASMTSHEVFFGTPRYMAPEQCKNASEVDGRADVYSLGCIVFEMLLGRTPFVYPTWGELVAAHIREEPPHARELDPDMPPAVDAVIARSLAKPIDERYQSMTELETALDIVWKAAVGGDRAALFAAATEVVRGEPAERGPKPTRSLAGEIATSTTERARRGWLWLGGALAAVAAGVTFAMMYPMDDEPPPAAASEPTRAPIAPPPPAPPPPVAAIVAPAPEPVVAPAPKPTVRLVVDSQPRGAIVYRASDGIRLGTTPFEHRYERTDGAAEFLVKLAGYHDARVSLTTRDDGAATAKLTRVPPPPRVRATKPKPSSTVLDPYREK